MNAIFEIQGYPWVKHQIFVLFCAIIKNLIFDPGDFWKVFSNLLIKIIFVKTLFPVNRLLKNTSERFCKRNKN